MKNLLSLLCLLAVVSILLACNTSPQKNPAFVKLSNRVDALEDTTKKIENSLKDLSFDVGLLDDQVESTKKSLREIATTSPADSQAIEVAMKNVSELDKQVKDLQSKLETQKKEFDAALKKQERAIETTRVTATRSSAPATTPAPKTTASSSTQSTPSAPSGFYYKVQSGDTLQSIAQRHGITREALSKANNLPASASILPGQSIYVPRS